MNRAAMGEKARPSKLRTFLSDNIRERPVKLKLKGDSKYEHRRKASAIGLKSKRKGQHGEREALALLREWLMPIYVEYQVPADNIKRNLDQVTDGGCDLIGLPWLAIEIKRREVVSLASWWDQTVAQAKPGEIPFLMWRCSRQPWRFRVRVPVKVGIVTPLLDVDMCEATAKQWIQAELASRIITARHTQT